jgi:hypothetical protein
MRSLAFADGSQLQSICENAFVQCPLETVVVPASVKEIDPSAFDPDVWRLVTFDGPTPLLINDFVCSADSRILLRGLSETDPVVIPAGIEVIGADAFTDFEIRSQIFAVSQRQVPKTFIVPSSVETIGARCFENCARMETITFGESSKLKRIGERAFAESGLASITIPAATEEIDGSAFVGRE